MRKGRKLIKLPWYGIILGCTRIEFWPGKGRKGGNARLGRYDTRTSARTSSCANLLGIMLVPSLAETAVPSKLFHITSRQWVNNQAFTQAPSFLWIMILVLVPHCKLRKRRLCSNSPPPKKGTLFFFNLRRNFPSPTFPPETNLSPRRGVES